MTYEMDPALKQKAEVFLKTNSELMGPAYGRSGVKRALDILVSSASSPLTLSVISLAGVAIWLDDGHWPFVNIGNKLSGYPVKEWKLRTMIPNAKELETEVLNGKSQTEFKRGTILDPRVTRVGKVLRKATLDEAPQMVNVFLGHLSAVGPRMPSEADWKIINACREAEPVRGFIEILRERLKYGVTGFYTLMGRNQLADSDRYALEIMYWEKQSFAADLRIIACTIPALIKSKSR